MYLQSAVKLLLAFCALVNIAAPISLDAQAGAGTILQAHDLQGLFPSTVFYRGQIAPAQLRNSGGVKFADGSCFLASLVDTSGYSSGITQKYQGYLITELPIEIAGKRLPPGAYGFGFIAGNRFVVTDIGGHDVLTAGVTADHAIKRPRPLEITSDPAAGFRLYAGRNYIRWSPRFPMQR